MTLKQVSLAEEYLQDHFPGFPVLPGVMMLEAMVQAGRRLLDGRAGPPPAVGGGADAAPAGSRLVLGSVRGLKYGRFVKPGEGLRVEVSVRRVLDGGEVELEGEGTLVRPGHAENGSPVVAVSGRFTLRPARVPHAGLPLAPAV